MKKLKDSTTWMKTLRAFDMNSIKQQLKKLCKNIKERHQIKLDNHVINKGINDGIRKNPNETITSLN